MPYRIELASGRTETVSYPPEPDGWTCASHVPCEDRVVKCEWIEPKTETRWRWTRADRRVDVFDFPPMTAAAWLYDGPDNIVKVERVEVEV